MSKIYVSAVPLTMVRTIDGGYRNVLEGDPIPGEAVDPTDLKRLVKKGFLEEKQVAEAEPDGPKPGTAAFILAEVGDDKVKAQAALDAENAKEKPGKGLVADLEKILAGS